MPVEVLRPNGVGASGLTPFGAAANWDCCDETPSDDDGTYVSGSSTDDSPHRDLYNIVDTGIPAGSTINSVSVHVNVRSVSSRWWALFRIMLKKSGAFASYGVSFEEGTTYAVHESVFAGVGLADLDALQIGVEVTSNMPLLIAYPGYCTQVWVEIDYSPPAGGVLRPFGGDTLETSPFHLWRSPFDRVMSGEVI